jgi:hypothetical protein
VVILAGIWLGVEYKRYRVLSQLFNGYLLSLTDKWSRRYDFLMLTVLLESCLRQHTFDHNPQ